MSVINFTVNFDLLATQTDSADAGVDVDTVALGGYVVFTPVLLDEKPILATNYQPRPAALKLRPIVGFIDVDGRLKASKSGPVGIRLVANDPVLELGGPLVYLTQFNIRTSLGEPVVLEDGYFPAPDVDIPVNLVDVLEPATVPLVNLSGGSFPSPNTVIFENSDGSVLEAITIPEGVVVFVDNGDSTWSVG